MGKKKRKAILGKYLNIFKPRSRHNKQFILKNPWAQNQRFFTPFF